MKHKGLTGAIIKRTATDNKAGKNNPVVMLVVIIVSVVILLTPQFLSNYQLNLVVSILLTAYFAQCWNLVSGFTGQFSFGHACFYGLGAYTSTILSVDMGVNPWLGMVIGMLVAGAVGAAIGFLSFHYNLRGDYFALATMAFCEIFRVMFNNSKALHGAAGLSVTYHPDVTQMQFTSRSGYLYMAFVMVAAITFALWKLRKSKTGLYFIAIRENEDAAKALGINAFRYKMVALIASAMLSAVAGTFYAQYYLTIDPTIVFSNTVSVNAITPCIIGGVGTVLGPVLGAFIIEPISELTNSALSGYPGLNMVAYGLILVIVIMVIPKGVIGLIQQLTTKVKENTEKKTSKEVQQA